MIASDRIVRSRVRILNNFPFFGILLLKFKVVEDKEIKTFATNGKVLLYNEEFCDSLNELELNWVMVHETMHCVLGHLWRRKDRNARLWNIACDYAIHSYMKIYLREVPKAVKFMKMPKNALYDTKYDNKTAEEIYTILLDEDTKGLEEYLIDDHDIWSERQDSGEEAKVSEREWKASVLSAELQARSKDAGSLGNTLERLIRKMVKPRVNWRTLINDCISNIASDYSFTPPDRRFSGNIFMLPDFNVTSRKLNAIFWLDVSGSMLDKELIDCYSEIVGCANQFESIDCYVGCFDADITKPVKADDITDIVNEVWQNKVALFGGGGTDFNKPIQYTLDNFNEQEIKCIIMLTDGYASFDSIPDTGDIELVWLLTNDEVEPKVGRYASIRNYE